MTERGGQPQSLRYDSAPVRRKAILSAVNEAGFVSVTALTERLAVSDMTVRRDLRKLEGQGQLRVVHGGASSVHAGGHSAAFAIRADQQAKGKERIGAAAAALLSPTETVAIDAGTTAWAVVRALPQNFNGTIVTHSIPVLQLLLARGGIRVVGLGGELQPASQAFVGPRTVEATHGLRVDTFILGAAGVDDRGVYVASDLERPTKHALIDTADRVVLVADTTKFTTSAPVLLCPWDQVDAVVSDSPLPPHVAEQLRALGTSVHLAQP